MQEHQACMTTERATDLPVNAQEEPEHLDSSYNRLGHRKENIIQ